MAGRHHFGTACSLPNGICHVPNHTGTPLLLVALHAVLGLAGDPGEAQGADGQVWRRLRSTAGIARRCAAVSCPVRSWRRLRGWARQHAAPACLMHSLFMRLMLPSILRHALTHPMPRLCRSAGSARRGRLRTMQRSGSAPAAAPARAHAATVSGDAAAAVTAAGGVRLAGCCCFMRAL